MKVEVEEIIHNKKRNPIAVDILNGQISSKLESNLKFDVYVDSRNKRVVAAHTENVVFGGEVNSDESMYNNFLVIRNKHTNKVRLVSYDTVSMESFTKKDASSNNKTVASQNGTRNDLTKQFGSKKAIRVSEQREKMKFDIENAKETLLKAVSELKADEGLLNHSLTNGQTEVDDAGYLPPINRNASSVEQVYELENLIPPEVLAGLESDVKTVLECDELGKLPLCHFCMQHLKLLKGNDQIKSDSTRCKIYLYLNYLIQFLTTPVKKMSKKFVLCESSTVVNFHILDNFSAVSKMTRTRSSSMRDKAICYILVLAMIASSNNQVDLEVLSQDTKLGVKKLLEIARMLLFTSSGSKKITLKLPLPAPLSVRAKKKK